MKTYFTFIKYTQEFLLGISILTLLILPLILVFMPNTVTDTGTLRIYDLSHLAVFLVMIVRPLADLLPKTKFVRPLVILRKGMGVFSASIIIAFMLAKIIMDPSGFFASIGTAQYWSMRNLALLAHAADWSAVILVLTSNTLSKQVLGTWWKRIQRLSYVFFYASSIYVFAMFHNMFVLSSMVVVTILTIAAYLVNKNRTNKSL